MEVEDRDSIHRGTSVTKTGMAANRLLVGGNPLEDPLLTDSEKNLKLIMKDGSIYKNTIGE